MSKNNSNKWISSNFKQKRMFTSYTYEKNPLAAKDLSGVPQTFSMEKKMGKTVGQYHLLQ
jgi:hypothetical protein